MLQHHIQPFLTSCKARGLADITINWYARNLAVYQTFLADKPHLRWDAAETIDEFLAQERDRGLKDNTVHARYRVLSVWFAWLLRRKRIPASPMEMVDAPRVDQEPIQHMTLGEYDTLTGSMNSPTWLDQRDHVLMYLLFWCGLRIDEACNLKIKDIDLAERVITITRRKGGKGGLVPCGDDLGPLILSYLVSRPPTDLDWLFVGSDGAEGIKGRFTTSGARQMMKKRCRRLGLRHLSPHKGRHGCATELLNAGLDMAAVSEVLGHASPQTTHKKYARYKIKPLQRQYNEVRGRILAERTR